MKKVFLGIVCLSLVSVAYGQQSPEEVMKHFQAGCEDGDKAKLESLFLQEGNHKKVADLLSAAYLEENEYRNFVQNMDEKYGKDKMKKEMPMAVGMYLRMLTFSPCQENVNMVVVDKADQKMIEATSPDWEDGLKVTLKLTNVDGKWLIEQKSRKDDYSDLIALLEGAKKGREKGSELLENGASVEAFLNAMKIIDKEVMANLQ